jgi:phosphatidylglycerol:prolipoprotein diacylglycerol transferase
MHQILFEIPIPFTDRTVPIFGFGLMLLLAFVACALLARRLARREGMNPDHILDMGIWLFVGGIIGARILFMITYPVAGGWWDQVVHFFKIWEGGLIFYGSIAGGLVGYLFAYRAIIRPNGYSTLKLADIVAPCIALGIFFGRLGCFLNGCCYGDLADPNQVSWGMRFPARSMPYQETTGRGYQTVYGFVLDGQEVRGVEADAARAGLLPGDRIVQVGGQRITGAHELHLAVSEWSLQDPLPVIVERQGKEYPVALPPPRSLPLHPTQLYSSLDGLLAFILLMAYYPFRRRPGEVMALYMVCYAVNRYLIEQLRNDTPATYFGMLTMAQAISLAVIVGAGVFWVWLRTRPREPLPPPAAKTATVAG